MNTNTRTIFAVLCLLIVAACSKEVPPPQPEPEPASGNRFTTFQLLPASNPGLNKLTAATITDSEIIIKTQSWIDNPDSLTALYTTNSNHTKVSLDGRVLSGNTTTFNYKKQTHYVLTGSDGSSRTYSLKFNGPLVTGLPVFRINTKNHAAVTSKETEVPATITISNTQAAYLMNKEVNIRGRGNTTWGYPKKPYRLKFDKKTSLMGLGAEKKWVLLANYQDPTLIMNDIAFELGDLFHMPYTNHAHHVEVFLNDSYMGNYTLTEQVEVAENRVNIDKNNGFLIELDNHMDEEWQFYSNRWQMPVMVKSPEITATPEMDFIKAAFHQLEDSLASPRFPNNGYEELIDIPSLIDYLLIHEVCQNWEPQNPRSTYMYRDATGKIFMGPLWDFDWGFGYKGWQTFIYFTSNFMLFYNNNVPADRPVGSRFFNHFFKDPQFRQQYKDRWNAMKGPISSRLETFITARAAELQLSQAENFKAWANERKQWEGGGYTPNYDAEIIKMKNWINARISLMDREINKF